MHPFWFYHRALSVIRLFVVGLSLKNERMNQSPYPFISYHLCKNCQWMLQLVTILTFLFCSRRIPVLLILLRPSKNHWTIMTFSHHWLYMGSNGSNLSTSIPDSNIFKRFKMCLSDSIHAPTQAKNCIPNESLMQWLHLTFRFQQLPLFPH